MSIEQKKELGGELDFEIVLKDGIAILSVTHEGKLGHAKFEVGLDAIKLVDKITDMIPGTWDDILLDGMAQKLLAKKTDS